jgi:hypothetical protein
MVWRASHNSPFIEEHILHLGMRCSKAINLLPVQSVGIQLVAGGHRLLAQKRKIIIQQIPTAAHDAKEFGEHRALRHAIN